MPPQQQPSGFSVFMANVPPDLTPSGLKIQLSPFLEQLRIEDWDCEKPRRKSFGVLSFLHRREGQAFLDKHGEEPIPGAVFNRKPRMKARLFLLQKPVFCRQSDKEVDPTFLRVLERDAEERNRPAEDVEETRVNHSPVVFETQRLLCGHYDYPNGTIAYIPDIQWSAGGVAKFARNTLIVTFKHSVGQIRLEFPYRTIHKVFISTQLTSLFLTLWEPPRIFLLPHQSDDSEFLGLFGNMRLTPGLPRPAERERLSKIPHDNADHSKVLGQSLIYCIKFSPVEFTSKTERLKGENEYLEFLPYNVPILSTGCSYMADGLASFASTVAACSQTIPFEILYQFQALVQNGYLLPHTVQKLLFRLQKSKLSFPLEKKEGAEATEPGALPARFPFSAPAVKKMFPDIPFPGPYTKAENFNPDEIWSLLETNEKQIQQGLIRELFSERARQNLTMVYKVQVTPTRIIFNGPEPEAKNRILRKFPRHTGYFARIQFCDEDGQDLFFNPKGAARIGQAFSETPIAVNLVELGTDLKVIPDVKSKDGSRVFSDGIGTISRELLEAIHDIMPQKSRTATCLQIRWAGAKGMLSLDDTLEGNVMCVRGSMIKFESLDVQNLEICDVANKPIPLVLNRQMIKILEDMRVPNSWFFKAQNRELNRLRKITAITNNTVVFLRRQKVAEQMGFSQFIRRLHRLGFDYKKDTFLCSIIEAVVLREVRLLKHKSRIPVEHGVTLFGVMDEFGFLGDEEVFITFDKQEGSSYPNLHNRLVIVTRSPALHPGDIQIRRAIVPPPGHPLRSLTNCIAFSQKGDRDLPSQLSGGDLDGDIYNVIWDPIAVDGCTREFAPADYPRVSPLNIDKDVQPSDMTDFFVDFMATDQLGLIAIRHIILADLHDAGTVHDECKLLAEMHSTAVDYSKTGIPVDISRMASLKTKYRPDFLAPAPPANIVDKTEIRFEAPVAPSAEADEDDDAGPKHMFYKSEKILGELYRAIDEKKIWRDDIHLAVNRFGPSLWDELFMHINRECDDNLGDVNWRRALDDAHNIRQVYDDAIWMATIDYSDHSSKAITELEVFTGTIFNKSGIQTRRQRDTSTRLKDEFDRITKWIEGLIRKKSSGDALDGTGDDPRDGYYEESTDPEAESTALELSIACLHAGVAGGVRRSSNERNSNDFESFKVIAAHCALRELEIAIKRNEMAEGAAFLGGGFPGVRNGRV
ncbi:hypothetical protein O1611_g4329 [Lasiodiplodia mahajangana]|uniref:Uncharacterized protein n=1 Tax=Lasiodiplodia mahajangana TaxID=1108764 RepID=A0ACC2JP71_9PEZI|nr:hypothetical protein O1611_g4329 [Lasiodiplodia mahajangana]